LTQFGRSIGSTLGVTVMGTIVNQGLPPAARGQGAVLHRLPPAARAQLAHALHPAFLSAAVVCALVLVIVVGWVREVPLRKGFDEPSLADELGEGARFHHLDVRSEDEWRAALDALPPDWSDVYAELELDSTDYLERAALLVAPLNPARYGGTPGFRFRAARTFGYGASPGMVRRCLERLDEEGVRGHIRILRALSDTQPVGTQGPVWRVAGRSV
jgi:hypothetical protein